MSRGAAVTFKENWRQMKPFPALLCPVMGTAAAPARAFETGGSAAVAEVWPHLLDVNCAGGGPGTIEKTTWNGRKALIIHYDFTRKSGVQAVKARMDLPPLPPPRNQAGTS